MEDNGFRREFDAVLAGVCRQIGVPPSEAQLLHLHGKAVFGFPAAGLVVRISGSQAALARITESLKVTAWLAETGFRSARRRCGRPGVSAARCPGPRATRLAGRPGTGTAQRVG
jgi:hypothetical protein